MGEIKPDGDETLPAGRPSGEVAATLPPVDLVRVDAKGPLGHFAVAGSGVAARGEVGSFGGGSPSLPAATAKANVGTFVSATFGIPLETRSTVMGSARGEVDIAEQSDTADGVIEVRNDRLLAQLDRFEALIRQAEPLAVMFDAERSRRAGNRLAESIPESELPGLTGVEIENMYLAVTILRRKAEGKWQLDATGETIAINIVRQSESKLAFAFNFAAALAANVAGALIINQVQQPESHWIALTFEARDVIPVLLEYIKHIVLP